ncbi:MAG: M15 family metallopeptidase [Bacilli bacterium]|nr:M15 family metallopeptidase [Bacilli bacterium]
MKKRLISLFILTTIIILTISYLKYDFLRLKLIGYNNQTITLITQKLSADNIDLIINTEKISNLDVLLSNEDFIAENFDDYFTLLKNNLTVENTIYIVNNSQEVNYNIAVSIIDNNNYIKDNLQRYLNYYTANENATIDDIITIVNNDVDSLNISYNEFLVDFINSTYFIKDNLEKYLTYYNQNNVSIEKTISLVNTKTDSEFYTNTSATDTSKKYQILVNKFYYLSSDYVPDNLVTIDTKYGYNYQLEEETYEHFVAMWESASEEGLSLFAASPYRSYETQSNLYTYYVNKDGKANADRYSARPGSSEHQTGLAIDIIKRNGTFDEFEYTMEYNWLLENAYKFGFILRYPEGKEDITGYMFESWHYRYVGVDVATKIYNLGITFDEYYAYFID